jgi:hypothetical protein
MIESGSLNVPFRAIPGFPMDEISGAKFDVFRWVLYIFTA